jgi:hypothetical protein
LGVLPPVTFRSLKTTNFAFPDSLAEAYLKDNNKVLAEVNYKKSLQLKPDNQNAKEKMKKMKN